MISAKSKRLVLANCVKLHKNNSYTDFMVTVMELNRVLSCTAAMVRDIQIVRVKISEGAGADKLIKDFKAGKKIKYN